MSDVMLDIFNRYAVGWMVAQRESAELAKRLIRESCDKEGIQYTMFLSDIKGNQSYEDSLFRFNAADYPETEIIELIE